MNNNDQLYNNLIPENEVRDFREVMACISASGETSMLRNDIILAFHEWCATNKKDDSFYKKSATSVFIHRIQELFLRENHMVIMLRQAPARYAFYQLRRDGNNMTEITVARFLELKEQYLRQSTNPTPLTIDFAPFSEYMPSMREVKNVGNGIRYLNRFMCSNIFNRPEEWHRKLFEFIKIHNWKGTQLLINGGMINDFSDFLSRLEKMCDTLEREEPETTHTELEHMMRNNGFAPGWGNTAARILETMRMLLDLLNEPTPELFETFLSRVPMPLVARIAIISPHGWFGQENVLGKPDTGGQVIYILDQVRALEQHLQRELALTGLDIKPEIVVITRQIPESADTSCHKTREKIFETENGWILRVPFRNPDGTVVRNWVSRFRIWPWLERFTDDCAEVLQSEFGGRPDLIIGNYSDGNLVATMLSDKMGVIQCTIAHALEKTKYLYSDLYWDNMEQDYNFSIQFTADLLAMNKTDFIVTNSLQEIIGSESTMGQYEAYQFFSMPGLYRVKGGINLLSPKFNVIPPGVDERIYFSYNEHERRIQHTSEYWKNRLFHNDDPDVYGHLDHPERPAIFSMARLDRIKNLTGLVEAYGQSPALQKHFNLIIAAGTIDAARSHDDEEKHEIARMYDLINHYRLAGKIRWLPSIQKLDTGEVYRLIADGKGIFVQPALFEAFGLTVIEAMVSGLPTFGPKFGGPSEIIEDNFSGFLLNTSRPDLIAQGLESFVEKIEHNPELWDFISDNGIRRVQEHFNWRNYSSRLVNLTKLYGFWRYSAPERERGKLDRYSDTLFHFLIRERAARL